MAQISLHGPMTILPLFHDDSSNAIECVAQSGVGILELPAYGTSLARRAVLIPIPSPRHSYPSTHPRVSISLNMKHSQETIIAHALVDRTCICRLQDMSLEGRHAASLVGHTSLSES
jgi:hypothetical protein